MKKSLAILGIAALALTAVASPVFAKDHGKEGNGWFNGMMHKMFNRHQNQQNSNQFAISGTVVSASTNSVTVKVQTASNVPNVANSLVTVGTDANTKITGLKNATLTLANLAANDRVVIVGSVSGTTLTATTINDAGPSPAQVATSSGKVTAVSTTSITISNAISAQSQTFVIDGNTKVSIDGVSKTPANIAVGDAGVIKSKATGTTFTAQMIELFR